MQRLILINLVLISLATFFCEESSEAKSMASPHPVEENLKKLEFTCKNEKDHLPPLNAETETLFQYARWLQKQSSRQSFGQIGRLYRIASANGNYKATNNLHTLISIGNVTSDNPAHETIDLVDELIKQRIPAGYYAMGHYLELGYGVVEDKEKALRYFRQAADMGNPDAQYFIAELLAPLDKSPEVAKQMRRCAANQGHGPAANSLGVDLQDSEEFPDAQRVLQQGIKSGDTQSASLMEGAFDPERSKSPIYFMGGSPDIERSRRYNQIRKFLHRYDGRNPKVPDIEKIVPLPPAPLPAWDGTFQWEKEFNSAKAPEMPSEALIKKLAQAKGLDPLTGLPLAKGK